MLLLNNIHINIITKLVSNRVLTYLIKLKSKWMAKILDKFK